MCGCMGTGIMRKLERRGENRDNEKGCGGDDGVVELRMWWRGSKAEGVTTKARRGTRPHYSLQHNFTCKGNIRTGKYDLPVRDAST